MILQKLSGELIKKLSIIEVPDNEQAMAVQRSLKEKNPRLVIFVRAQLAPDTSERAVALIQEGAEVLHLVADEYGLEKAENPLFIKERMKQIHLHPC